MELEPPSQPVVVTFREVEKALTGREALEALPAAADADTEAPAAERAAVMAAVGTVLNQLRRAEETAGAMVLTTPHHAPSCRLQSLIASGEAAKLKFEPLPSGGLEAKFDTHDWFGWASVAWQKLKHFTPHAMLRPSNSVAQPLPPTGRLALLGDWGTGLYGAPEIGKAVRSDPDPFVMLLHLGDVYYSGTGNETKERFVDVWPKRPEAISRTLNSNHDMYSGGEAYFGSVLPAFRQEGSYFAFQNDHWTLVGLDVAYQDHAIDDLQVAWLKEILAKAGDRKVVLFSHHQLYSHFESQGSKLWSHPGFGAILRSKRIFAWYWGHEHRCVLFEEPDPTFGILRRVYRPWRHAAKPRRHPQPAARRRRRFTSAPSGGAARRRRKPANRCRAPSSSRGATNSSGARRTSSRRMATRSSPSTGRCSRSRCSIRHGRSSTKRSWRADAMALDKKHEFLRDRAVRALGQPPGRRGGRQGQGNHRTDEHSGQRAACPVGARQAAQRRDAERRRTRCARDRHPHPAARRVLHEGALDDLPDRADQNLSRAELKDLWSGSKPG